jgi:hypothetical protein
MNIPWLRDVLHTRRKKLNLGVRNDEHLSAPFKEVRMSDSIPKTPGSAENLTKDFSVAVLAVDMRV